jgi:hypothetical protein
VVNPSEAPEPTTIELKDPALAAFLAWLWPGAGHLYQGRTAKGMLFMICILGTFFYGFFLGGGRVVYAAWKPEPFRWPYICQVAVGVPALPAVVEAVRANADRDVAFDQRRGPLFGERRWYHPPKPDELNQLLLDWNRYFELGTVFTMIAGLLNVLAIYDAWGGPAYAERKKQEEPAPPKDEKPDGKSDGE